MSPEYIPGERSGVSAKNLQTKGSSDPCILAEQLDGRSIEDLVYKGCGKTELSIWKGVERLLAEGNPETPLDVRIEGSYHEALRVLGSEAAKDEMQARMFLANIDLMALRANKQKIGVEDIRRSYFAMANTLADTLQVHDSEAILDDIAEMVTYALVARHGDLLNVPFVASPRERHSATIERNHAIYTVDNDLTLKTAIRVRRTHSPLLRDERSPFIYAHYSEGFIAAASSDLSAVQKIRTANPEKTYTMAIAELIADEPYEGYDSASPAGQALSKLSEGLIAQLNEHRLRVLGIAAPKSVGRTMRRVAESTARPSTYNLPPKDFWMTYKGRRFINPYLRAEYVPPEVLEQLPFRNDELIIGPIWKDIELGLATRDKKRILAASDEARNVTADRNQETDSRIAAAMIAANSKLLAPRVTAELTTEKEIWESFLEMASVLDGMVQYQYGLFEKEDFVGMRAEMINYCLIAYQANSKFIPYLGSHREERSHSFIANHDLYTLPDKTRASKTAAQIKNAFHASHHQRFGTPDNPRHTFMFPLYTTEVLQQQAEAMGVTGKNRQGIREAARLIVRASLNKLTAQEEMYLKGYSDKILQLFTDHQQYLRAKEKWHKMPFTTAPSSQEYIAGL